jgi:hypothetical protein
MNGVGNCVTDSSESENTPTVDPFEHGNEPSGTTEMGKEFPDKKRGC